MTTATLVRAAFDAMELGDAEAFLAHFHDELVFELPYADSTSDKAGLAAMVELLLRTFASRRFVIDAVHEVTGGAVTIAEYRSESIAHVRGIRYANRYVGIFELRDGRISRWTEYANPVPLRRALAAISDPY